MCEDDELYGNTLEEDAREWEAKNPGKKFFDDEDNIAVDSSLTSNVGGLISDISHVVDHGLVTWNPLEPRFDPGAGETGQWVYPNLSRRPFFTTLDHGQMLIDPLEPRFDPGAGETGQWIDPAAPPPGFNPLG